MNINQACLDLIKQFEGFRATPYHGEDDPANLFTIGYGTTFYPNGKAVQLSDLPITEQQAETLLKWQVQKKAFIITSYIVPNLSDNKFGALVSFAYNCGENALRSSTLLKRVNANPIDTSIRDAFMMWCKDEQHNIVEGLQRRRAAEADLYFTT